MARVLIVDDDRAVRSALQVNLTKAGFEVQTCSDGQEALLSLEAQPVDLVLSDVKMPGMTGIVLLGHIREKWPSMPVVIMTGHGTVDDAVAALKQGAEDYIIKPVSKDELIIVLQKAIDARALQAELIQLRQEVAAQHGFQNIIGATPAMQDVYELVATVATSDALVLLTGPTGTGKELIAHAIHYRSQRKEAPFVRVNCAALPEGLMESELFGHEKGSFTGAIRQHHGKFEQAHGGTLLLDEIGEIPLSTQVKLLRVLEVGEIQRVGGDRTLQVDVRVIASTNRSLRKEVKEGTFREDLFYRLNVFNIEVPSLAQRCDDIPLLVDHFVKRYAERHKTPLPRVTPDVMSQLMAHPWPGNVRELEHTLERAVILARGETIDAIRLPVADDEDAQAAGLLPLGKTIVDVLEDTERSLIVEALRREKGVQARAARRLGVSRSNLNYRINKLGISVRDVDIG